MRTLNKWTNREARKHVKIFTNAARSVFLRVFIELKNPGLAIEGRILISRERSNQTPINYRGDLNNRWANNYTTKLPDSLRSRLIIRR